jgi:hypothetical protein
MPYAPKWEQEEIERESYGIKSLKVEFFKTTGVRTSNPTRQTFVFNDYYQMRVLYISSSTPRNPHRVISEDSP